MHLRGVILAGLHLLILLTFFLGALFFSFLPLTFERLDLVKKAPLIGAGLFLAGLFLLLSFYLLHKGKFFVIKMGVVADVRLIRHTLNECITRQFPDKISLSQVEIGRKSRIEIKVSLQPQERKAKKALLVDAEREFGNLLRDRFGYTKPFYLILK
jgi:hypothetical protein